MKLEEIKLDIEVKVNDKSVLKMLRGKTGYVVSIIPNVPYPIEVDIRGVIRVFKPEELDKV